MIRDIFLLQNPWRESGIFPFKLKSRDILKTLLDNMNNELILGLVGSRQVGKSSIIYLLISKLLESNVSEDSIFYFNLDDNKLHQLFNNLPDFIQFLGDRSQKKYVFIDEIQRLKSPGLFLKQIFDLRRDIKIVYSGSSQLEVKAKTKEHLVGRSRLFIINRLSFNEFLNFSAPITKREALNAMLLYGSYPAVVKETNTTEKLLRIKDIFQAYVQKDLVEFLNLKDIESFNKFLVRAANNIGDLLNINSISKDIGVNRNKLVEYLNVLEYTFICKRIFPFHKNYNKEITKTPKLYFLDLGLRNFILNSFNELDLRNDTGSLFENFVLNEFIANDFHSLNKINFWRTTNKTEVDFIIQKGNKAKAIEVKWNNKRRPKAFDSIESLYPEMETQVITKYFFV